MTSHSSSSGQALSEHGQCLRPRDSKHNTQHANTQPTYNILLEASDTLRTVLSSSVSSVYRQTF